MQWAPAVRKRNTLLKCRELRKARSFLLYIDPRKAFGVVFAFDTNFAGEVYAEPFGDRKMQRRTL
jgi:hypothetical protein